MSFRISFGSRWFEFHLFSALMLGAMDVLHIQYGHNSTRNLIRILRNGNGTIAYRWRNNRPRLLKRRSYES